MRQKSRLASLRSAPDTQFVKSLRSSLTDAEQRLWYHLRARRFQGFKFRRQVPLGPYVVDFLCEEACLIVEIDGGQHAERLEKDLERTQWLRMHGYDVVRFWNNEVMGNAEGVLQSLLETLSPALPQGGGRNARPSPRPSPKGEGEKP